jgi:diguanylate cyclase (GGDEF)-like protein
MRRSHQTRDLDSLDEFARAIGQAVADDVVIDVLLDQSRQVLDAELTWLVDRGAQRVHLFDGERHWEEDSVSTSDQGLLDMTRGNRVVNGSQPDLLRGMEHLLAAQPTTSGEGEFLLAVGRRAGKAFRSTEESAFARLVLHAGVALQHHQLVHRLRAESEANHYLANHDALTGLPSRSRFNEDLTEALVAGQCAAVLLLDLDRFKEVNDTLGHHNGDVVLEEVGRRISHRLTSNDLVSRLGGDEFAVLLRGARTEDEVYELARGIEVDLKRPFSVADLLVDVGASIGIALPARGESVPDDVLRRADVAMYAAKSAHEGVKFYTVGLDHYSPQRLALVPRFRRAIERSELHLYYQPQIDLATGEVTGAETLLRWPQPGAGFVPPGEFIPMAERTDLIGPLTRLVLAESILQCADWHARGWPIRSSVNLSARNLNEPDLAEQILSLVQRANLPPGALCVELTETAVMSQPERCRDVLGELKSKGIEIAIDDFGTGQSSLAYLTTLPVDELKIDRSFVMALGEDPAAESVVWAIVNLGLNLGLEVVAEGVETTRSASILLPMGCRVAQGFLYGRPMPAEGFARWYADRMGATALSDVEGVPAVS